MEPDRTGISFAVDSGQGCLTPRPAPAPSYSAHTDPGISKAPSLGAAVEMTCGMHLGSQLGEVLQPDQTQEASVSLPGPKNMAGGYREVIWNGRHMWSKWQHSASINKATR